jgi:mannosyltransferase OCH1-like enzyme
MILKNICSMPSEDVKTLKLKLKKKYKMRLKTKKKPKKYIYDSSKPQVIPLHIYQVWHNIKEMPPSVKESVIKIKEQNPEFEYHLYDEPMCRKYIQDHFPKRVLDAYDKVTPYALKADLWRYCILYREGGIYLDSKYSGINNFKFIHLVDKEYFCKDILYSFAGIYNAIIICKPNNSILKNSLDQFVKNTEENYYGSQALCIGPLMMRPFFKDNEYNSLELSLEVVNSRFKFICFNGYRILKFHEKYTSTRKKYKHWTSYWKKRSLYL